jgi:hypothetical protein
VIIQPCTAETLIINVEAQRMHQMQSRAGVRTNAYDIARVGGNLRLKQNKIKHVLFPFLGARLGCRLGQAIQFIVLLYSGQDTI